MEKYKKKLEKRMKWLSVAAIILIILITLNVVFANQLQVLTGQEQMHISGLIPLLAATVIWFSNYKRIVKNDKLLKLEYNKANDERTKAIMAKAGLPIILYTSLVIILVGVIALNVQNGFAVGVTLYIVGMAQIIVAIIVKFIYMKKM